MERIRSGTTVPDFGTTCQNESGLQGLLIFLKGGLRLSFLVFLFLILFYFTCFCLLGCGVCGIWSRERHEKLCWSQDETTSSCWEVWFHVSSIEGVRGFFCPLGVCFIFCQCSSKRTCESLVQEPVCDNKRLMPTWMPKSSCLTAAFRTVWRHNRVYMGGMITCMCFGRRWVDFSLFINLYSYFILIVLKHLGLHVVVWKVLWKYYLIWFKEAIRKQTPQTPWGPGLGQGSEGDMTLSVMVNYAHFHQLWWSVKKGSGLAVEEHRVNMT